MPELFSREYAEKIGEALDRANCTTVALAFQRALQRKLGRIDSPVPSLDGPNVTDAMRFEYMFDSLFNVVPEKKPLEVSKVREIFEAAIFMLDERVKESEASSAELYQADMEDYVDIVKLLDAGNERDAAQKYMDLDTAAREWANGESPAEDYQFALWLDQYDTDKPNGLPNIKLMGYQSALSEAI